MRITTSLATARRDNDMRETPKVCSTKRLVETLILAELIALGTVKSCKLDNPQAQNLNQWIRLRASETTLLSVLSIVLRA
jgi:hypothetical protein